MSWETVLANTKFWTSPADTWGNNSQNSNIAFSTGERNAILAALQNLYNGSAEARNLLEAGTTGREIRIFQTHPDNAGVRSFQERLTPRLERLA